MALSAQTAASGQIVVDVKRLKATRAENYQNKGKINIGKWSGRLRREEGEMQILDAFKGIGAR
jgi:hypothetical protein